MRDAMEALVRRVQNEIVVAIEAVDGGGLTLVDIGDSSGQHGEYIRALAPAGKVGRFVSVNLDPVAVEKVRARGGDAILCRAEEHPHAGLALSATNG